MPLSDLLYEKEDESEKRKGGLSSLLGRKQSNTGRANTNLNLARDEDPDKEAKILDVSKQTGHSPELVRGDTEGELEKQLAVEESKKPVSRNKGLSSFLTDYNNAALAKDDTEALANVEDNVRVTHKEEGPSIFDKMGQAFRAGRYNVELAHLRTQQLFGDDSPELLQRIEDLKTQQVVSPEDEGILEKIATGVAEQVPILFNVSKEAIETGAKYGLAFGAGAAVVGQLGPQVLTPEELITVPTAGAVGFGAGYKVGSAAEMFNIEAGLAYDELLGLRDENGEPIDDTIIKAAAFGIGSVNAGLEFVAFQSLMKTIPGVKKLFGKMTTGTVKEMLKRPSVRKALAEAAKGYAGVITAETATEFGQEVVNIIGGEIAKSTSEVLEGTEFAPLDKGKALERALEAGAEGFYASVGLGLPGPTVTVATSVVETSLAPQESQTFVENQTALNEAVNTTKTKERSPDKVNEFLKTVGLDDEVFISPEGIQVLFQTDPEAAKEILDRIGVDPDDALFNAEIGQDTRAMSADLQAYLSPEEFSLLVEDIKPAPGVFTQREINNQDSIAEISRLTDLYAEVTQDEETFQAELKRVETEVVETMGTLGQFKDTNIEEYAANYIKSVEAVANRFALQGTDRTKLVKSITVGREDLIKQLFKDQILYQEDREIGGYTVYDEKGSAVLSTTSEAKAKVDAESLGGRYEAFYKDQLPTEGLAGIKPKQSLNLFNDPMLKGKEGKKVKLETIIQIMRQKGTTNIEKEIVGEVLANEMNKKDRGQIQKLLGEGTKDVALKENVADILVDYDAFKATVEGALMPLDTISTSQWADYGASNLRFVYEHSESIVYNSPIHHGFGDHFAKLFSTYEDDISIKKVEYEVVEIPERPGNFLAMDVNRPDTRDPEVLEEYVGSAGSKRQVEVFIEEYNNRTEADLKAGVFGHVRRWYKAGGTYIAEMQSDFYQKKEPEVEVSMLVIDNPKTKGQKKIAAKYQKAIGAIESASQEVTRAYKRATILIENIRDTEKNIKRLQAELAEQETRTGTAYNPSVIGEKRRGIRNSEEAVIKWKLELTEIADPKEQSFIEYMRTKDDLVLRGLKFDEEKQIVTDKEGNERTALFRKMYKGSQKLSGVDIPDFKQEYESYFYAMRDKKNLLHKDIPKTFTPIQKQFVAHRKNYSERMLREEIRQAAKDGKERLLLPLPHTVAAIEGYIQPEFTDGISGEGELYTFTEGDIDNPEIGDEINYLEEDYYITEVYGDSIEVAKKDAFNVWSVSEFISNESNYSWDNTSYELPDEFKITVTHKPDDTQPGLLESEIEEEKEHRLYEDDKYILSWENTTGDEWYGEISEEQIVEVLSKEVEDLIEDYDGSGIITVDTNNVSDEFYDIVAKQIEERYSDDAEVIENLTGSGAYGSVSVRDGYIYSINPGEVTGAETLPYPPRGEDTEAIGTDEGPKVMDKEDFQITDVSETYQGIVKKYETLGKSLKKILPEGFEVVEDDMGFDWYSAKIPPEAANEPVQLFQIQNETKRGATAFADEGYLVSLFEDADLSTLFHETGHIFLNEMRAAVESGQASKSFMKDYKTILKWVGSKDGSLNTEQHEKFARGFEAYLLEGKAPSTELETAFSRFRRWLSEVYKSAKQLNVSLTNEVRGVFDRLLVAEHSVNSMASDLGMSPKTQEELNALGVLPEDQAFMKRLIEEAKNSAESAMIKDRNRSQKENKKRWREEAAAQITANPIYQVIETISKAKGLDKSALVEEYGEPMLETMPKHWFREDGLDPNTVALAAGFQDAVTMLSHVMSAPPKQEAIEMVVERKQQEHDAQFLASDYLANTNEYGEYLAILGRYYEGPVKDTADTIDPMTKGDEKKQIPPKLKTPKTISRQAFSKFVKKVLDSKSTRDAIRHDRYLSAMKKAQARERRAIMNGDMLEASKANEQARLNYEMAGKAIANRKLVEKILRNAKAAARNTNIEVQHRENISSLVERFSLADNIFVQRPLTMTPLSNIIKGGDFADNFPASDFLLSTVVKDYRDLAFTEMKEVGELINYLTIKGRDKRKALLSDGKTSVEKAAFESASESANMDAKPIRKKFSTLRGLTNITRPFFAMLDSLNFMAIAKGGYKNVGRKGERSKTEGYIIDPIIAAQNAKDQMNAEVYERLQPFLDRIFRTVSRDWMKKYGRKIVVPGTKTPFLFEQDGQSGWWTGEQIFSIALNMGNEGNYQRLIKGYPDLTKPTIDKLLSMLTTEDMDAIQGVWDVINSLYPEISKVHTKMNNFFMGKVEAESFVFKDKTYNGGYYPAVFDPKMSLKVAAFTETDDLLSRSEAIRQVPASKSGMTKQRKEGVSLPLKLSLNVATGHIRDSILYITHAEILRDIDRITRHETFANETIRLLGQDVYDMIRPALKYIARPVRDSVDTKVDKAVGWVRGRTTAFILAWNASVATKQVFSSPSVAFDIGPLNYVKGFMHVLTHVGSNYQLMTELSPYMAQRAKSMDRELQDMFNKMSADQKAVWFGDKAVTWDMARNFGFWPIRVADMSTVIPIWWGAYNKEINKTGDLDAAISYADDTVRRTQPSAQPLDMPQWMRTGGVSRLFSSFQTFTVGKYGQRQRLHYRAWKAGKLSAYDYAWFNFCDVIVPAVAMNTLFALLWGKDFEEDETWKSIGVEVIKYAFLTGVPFLGSLFSVYGKGLETPLSAGFDHIKRAIKDGAAYATSLSAQDLEKLLWDLAHLESYRRGVPASRVVEKTLKGIEQEEENIPGVRFIIPAPKR